VKDLPKRPVQQARQGRLVGRPQVHRGHQEPRIGMGEAGKLDRRQIPPWLVVQVLPRLAPCVGRKSICGRNINPCGSAAMRPHCPVAPIVGAHVSMVKHA